MVDNVGDEHRSIVDYWSVQPPFRANDDLEPGTREWYASISTHRYAVVPYMKDWVGFDAYRGKRVLEIGCGAGADLSEFARHGAQVTGIDVTETAVELASNRLQVEGLPGSVLTYSGDSLPLDDESFDLVYSWGVLHHTPFMDQLFSDVHRVLVPGGEFKAMFYNRKSLLYYYSILYLRQHLQKLGGNREEILSTYSEFRTGCPYTRCFSDEEMRSRLWFFSDVVTQAKYCVYDTENDRKLPGDHVIEVESTGIADIDIFLRDYNDTVADTGSTERFGWHLVVKATK